MDNRVSIYFGEHQTKSILFASKSKIKKVPKLNITNKNKQFKKLSEVTYLGCILDEAMSGESVALKVINKIRLKFLLRKKNPPGVRRLLCHALIQPHFDYASSTWYPNLTSKKEKQKSISRKINPVGIVYSWTK